MLKVPSFPGTQQWGISLSAIWPIADPPNGGRSNQNVIRRIADDL